MRLHVREWGAGDRVAVLIHGITSDSGAWWRFAEELVGRGYRVLAPDLRGHGLSPRGDYSPMLCAGDLLESLPARPQLAVGHSLGGLALALVVEQLGPSRVVYEDPAWHVPAARQAAVASDFVAQKGWGREEIAAANPRWPEGDVDAKLASLRCWDPETAIALLDGTDWDYTPHRPAVPSLVQLADPSALVPPERAKRLRQDGFEVRVVPGAGHSIHRDDFAGFLAGLEGWL